jgi:acyl-homoserine lactone acylase PvdQ
MRRLSSVLLILGLLLALPLPALAQELEPAPHRGFDDAEGFRNVMPPGQKGVLNAAEALAAQGGQYPDHVNDQTPLYELLVYEGGQPIAGDERTRYLGITDGDLPRFFKDASFGPAEAARTYSPTEGLTITRGSDFGVPTIVGETRAATMFGAGYAAAEDRMFLMDLLRHVGRARMSEFLGASPANMAMDREQLAVAPYTEEELTQQVADICALGPEGVRACEDLDAYTEGVNAYFAEARTDPSKLPAEYPALQIIPEDWIPEDTVAIASLVGGIFGRGGGNEVASGLFLSQLQARHGAEEGLAIWRDFRSANDPDAPTTTDRSFPYNNHIDIDPASTALLDLESAEEAVASMARTDLVADGPFGPIDLNGLRDSGMSNALLTTADRTDGNAPIAVFGPQTGYFTPQLLVEMDIHGPGISARGAAFAGTNIYVQLGRGRDYAWSATSASADNVDQWVLELCDPDGDAPTLESQAYFYDGECREMDVYEHEQFAKPTAGGIPGSPGDLIFSETVERVPDYNLAPILARGTVQGRPVAIAEQRSTYGSELRSAIGFQRINDPEFMTDGVASFNAAFDGVDYTFNWFYIDDTDIAYKHSCLCPIRDPRTDPDLPTWGTGEWDWTGDFLTPEQQPQDVNPESGYIISWNNKQAPDFRANDGQYSYSSTYRSEFLEAPMRAALAGPRQLTRADVTNITMDGGTADLNGHEIYPLVLRILGEAVPDGDATLARMRDELATWVAAGGHRRDLDRDGEYDHAIAVAIGDAVLRPMLDAVFGEVIGDADLPQVVEDSPRLGLGSAFNGGQANFLHKDFMQVLGDPIVEARSRTYCGGGDAEACRSALWDALSEAAEVLADEYGSDDVDDWVYDSERDEIIQSAGGVTAAPPMQWQNRPTFQMVVQVGTRVGRVSGTTRTFTSAAVSRQAFPDGTDTVVVASSQDFPDALTGTPLAAALGAPVLLTPQAGLAGEIAREVERLGATTAVVLGGTAALSEQVVEDLQAAGVEDVQRIGGTNRFDTARLVAEELDSDAGSAVVASGEQFADALAAGPFAAATGQPILLTAQATLPGETVTALEGLGAVVIAGGGAAVSAEVEAALAGDAEVRRVGGADRFATGVLFAEEAMAADADVADTYVVTGTQFPDALSAGAAAAEVGGVLVLAAPDRLGQTPPVATFLQSNGSGVDRLWMVGGQAALSTALRSDVETTIAR